MARTPEEKIHAMQLLAEGKSRAEVSRLTGFDTKTLAIYWTRYLKDGDAAFKRKRKGYSPKLKKAVIHDFETKNQSLSFLSAHYGIPIITLKRWMAAKEQKGFDGFKDGRHQNPGPRRIMTLYQVRRALTLSLHSLSNYPAGARVRTVLDERGAFKNPLFGFFMECLYGAYEFAYSREEFSRSHEDILKQAYITARLELRIIPPNLTEREMMEYRSQRKETEGLLELFEIDLFIHLFAKCIPAVIREYNNK